jgi:outer membrane lipoprotein carrier protein
MAQLTRPWSAIVIMVGLSLNFLVATGALAAPPSADDILKGLAARHKGLEGLSAAYTRQTQTTLSQDIFQDAGGQLASGQLSWRKPARLRLDQAEPTQELMVTDGETIWWYLPAEKQAHVYRQLDLAGEMAPLLSFLTNLDELKKSFRIKKLSPDPTRPGQTGLFLDPKKKDSATGQIVAWCDETFQLTGFDLLAVTGEKTSFFLTKFQPQTLDLAQFSFKVPKGVKVIEETGS